MDFGPGMFGMGGFGHLIGAIVGALFGFFMFLVVIGILFLLVRFLLAATKAAHIYIAKNSPAHPAASADPTTTVAAAAKPAAAKPSTTKPATKPRSTKPPTA